MQDEHSSTTAIKLQTDFQVGCRQEGVGTVRPFDKADPFTFEILIQTGFEKFMCMGESIKIKVIYDYSRIFIRFNQGICRALHLAGVA